MSPDHVSASGGSFSLRITAAIAAGVWISAVGAYLEAACETDSILAVCLLGIPVAVCIALSLRHGSVSGLLSWLLGVTLGLVAFQGLVLLVYTFRSSFGSWIYDGFSLMALVAAVGAVVGSLWLASMMLISQANGSDPNASGSVRLVRSLRGSPAVAICFFVAVFCLVTIFLAFGLAFHDQGLRLAAATEDGETVGDPAEEAETEPEPRASFGRPPVGLYAFPVGPPLPAPWATSPGEGREGSSMEDTRKVRFVRGETAVLSGHKYRFYSDRDIEELRGEELIAAINEQQLEEVTDRIASSNGHSRIQVVIAGHADDIKPSDGRTNFEISSARANQVWLEILRRLHKHKHEWSQNIQWYPMAFGDQGTYLDPEFEYLDDSQYRLLVEVVVLPSSELLAMPVEPERLGRPLDLLDYLYFTVYTVTTTGYGDIVPVSGYAKLTTSLANLAEFLFMVIFFNVLVSFLRKPVPVSGTSAS